MTRSTKIKTPEECRAQIEAWHQHGFEVVFTNGCFDILHIGHIKCLRSARDLGDKLVVAVNSNESVRLLKGENRPINDLSIRMEMLEALDAVDVVVSFDEDTPEQLIQLLSPDVLVKGDQYERNNIAGAEHVINTGGIVETIPMVGGHSTTELIQKIKNL